MPAARALPVTETCWPSVQLPAERRAGYCIELAPTKLWCPWMDHVFESLEAARHAAPPPQPARADGPLHVRTGVARRDTGYASAALRGSRHIPLSTGPPPGNRTSSRTVKPKYW